ncbi:MAG: hypothetical protein GY861_16830 [bacterium]|nr:hypothetical protein [bacterium]
MAWVPIQEQLSGTPIVATSAASGVTYTGYATAYEITHTPIVQTFSVFLNSGFQRLGIDYELNNTTLSWTTAIPTGDNVFVTYFYDNRQSEPFNPDCQDHDPVTPAGVRGSTTLNPVVTSYELLSERIKMQIGWPMTNIELCDDQIYDFINQATEWYSKYAGFIEEYLIFDSNAYECGRGMKVDTILNNIADFYCPCSSTPQPSVSAQYVDCDLNNYRKVVGIFSVDPAGGQGGSSEVLFNMDYLFAQQAYFGQMMGGFGYDITTWHMLKEWMDLRKKMFATAIDVIFNPTSQTIKLIPEPQVGTSGGRYVGVIGCRMEKSVAELVQERWVQRYALALTKIALAHVRGKFGQVTLFGGGTINGQDLMTQGREDKAKLEAEIQDGYGEAEPPLFFIE